VDTSLGLLGLVAFVAFVIALAAGVTWAVVKVDQVFRRWRQPTPSGSES
jgi:hypothetical protein